VESIFIVVEVVLNDLTWQCEGCAHHLFLDCSLMVHAGFCHFSSYNSF